MASIRSTDLEVRRGAVRPQCCTAIDSESSKQYPMEPGPSSSRTRATRLLPSSVIPLSEHWCIPSDDDAKSGERRWRTKGNLAAALRKSFKRPNVGGHDSDGEAISSTPPAGYPRHLTSVENTHDRPDRSSSELSDSSWSELSQSASTASSSFTTLSACSGDMNGSPKHVSVGHSEPIGDSFTTSTGPFSQLDLDLVGKEALGSDERWNALLAEIRAFNIDPFVLKNDVTAFPAPSQKSRSKGLLASPIGPPPSCPLPLLPTEGNRSVSTSMIGPPPSCPLPPVPIEARAGSSSRRTIFPIRDERRGTKVCQKLYKNQSTRHKFKRRFIPHLRTLVEGKVVN